MADTTNYGWTKPTDQASDDTWGVILNQLFDDVDATLFAQLALKLPKNAPAITGAGSFAASLVKLGKGQVLYHDDATFTAGKITVSTSAPSGSPAKGEIWMQVASGTGWKEATVYVGMT